MHQQQHLLSQQLQHQQLQVGQFLHRETHSTYIRTPFWCCDVCECAQYVSASLVRMYVSTMRVSLLFERHDTILKNEAYVFAHMKITVGAAAPAADATKPDMI